MADRAIDGISAFATGNAESGDAVAAATAAAGVSAARGSDAIATVLALSNLPVRRA